MRTALVCPPVPDRVTSPMPLTGPAILASHLRRGGHAVDVVDLATRTRHARRFRFHDPFDVEVLFDDRGPTKRFVDGPGDARVERAVERLLELGRLDRYDVVGFSIYSSEAIGPALCISTALKRRRPVTILFGGPVVGRMDIERLLAFDVVDGVVVGDGELALDDLLSRAEPGRPLELPDASTRAVPGLAFRRGDGIVRHPPQAISLEEKAPPVFDASELTLHRALGVRRGLHLPYILTRGCRWKCFFCSEYPDVRFTYAPLQKVVDDVARLLSEHRPDSIYFVEANLNNDPQRLLELCEGLRASGLRFKWGGMASAAGLSEPLVRAMAEAGCRYLFLGIESGSEPLMERFHLRKYDSVAELERVLERLHRHGIRTHTFYVADFPYETAVDHERTRRLIERTARWVTTASATPFVLSYHSPIMLRPHRFRVRLRGSPSAAVGTTGSPSAGLGVPDRWDLADWTSWDETEGGTYEEKTRAGEEKARELNRVILRHVTLPLLFRLFREDPLYPARALLRRPYESYDVYL